MKLISIFTLMIKITKKFKNLVLIIDLMIKRLIKYQLIKILYFIAFNYNQNKTNFRLKEAFQI